MPIQVPPMNPVRFYNTSTTPDYDDYWPNPDNVVIGERSQKALHAIPYVREHRLNKQISIQARLDSVDDLTMAVFRESNGTFSQVATITPTEISPSGWVAFPVYRYNYTPTVEGRYYFKFNGTLTGNQVKRSDEIFVHSRDKFLKQMIHIKYWNTENDFGMVFFDGDTQVYTGNVYYSGQLVPGEVFNDVVAYKGDPGHPRELRNSVVSGDTIQISDVHWAYKKSMLHIFACDNKIVNGMEYAKDDGIEIDAGENKDVVNINLNLLESDASYFYTDL